MFGFQDLGVSLAYLLTILSALLCVVYGIINWNHPREDQVSEIKEEQNWEKRDPELGDGGAE